MLNKILKITLKSDICIGSGYSYAGIIDGDSCYDSYGLPYIPARRIKGCLREAAENIGADTVEGNISYFGERAQGFDSQTCFAIYDAMIENYDNISAAIKAELSDMKDENDIGRFVEGVLAQYTSVKAQTRIDENGVAEEMSLRFTRTVNHYNPINRKELSFYAAVKIDSRDADTDNKIVSALERTAKALRHIGIDRNRGLGNVVCELIDDNEIAGAAIKDNCTVKNKATLRYMVKTVSPIMISKNSNRDSETYINGQTVHGFFASRYLAANSADDDFENMFLRNKVIFSPLYPAKEDGSVYYPAPSYICKLKKTGYAVNTAAQFPDNEQQCEEGYYHKEGNQPKKLKGKYIRMEDAICGEFPMEVKTEIIYHNRHAKGADERQLYVTQAIEPGQYFAGTVSGDYDDVCKLAGLLENSCITFGKSRKAQYGRCVLVCGVIEDNQSNSVVYDKGKRILVTLRSDAVFMGDCGYTVRTEDVRRIIKDTLNIEEEEIENDIYSEIEVKELTGYYSIWNLKRQAIPVVCAGSTFEFKLAKEAVIESDLMVGEKKGEGFGAVSVRENDREWKVNIEERPDEEPAVSGNSVVDRKCIYPLKKAIVLSDIRANIQESIKADNSMNSALIGRITLMLTESINENRDDIGKVRHEFDKRIKSIKDDTKRENARRIVNDYYEGIVKSEKISNMLDKIDVTDDELVGLKIYSLRQALILMKYNAKERG